jgi:WD40 repeat protein
MNIASDFPENISCLCGEWQAHQDIVWELNHHISENYLLSSSADGTIKLWQTFQEELEQ